MRRLLSTMSIVWLNYSCCYSSFLFSRGVTSTIYSSCVLYDSRLLHCGSANRMIDTNRAIFYFSFRNPAITYPGNPPSIRSDLQHEHITLQNLQNVISNIHNDNGHNPFHFD
jgi:hypothetical protein